MFINTVFTHWSVETIGFKNINILRISFGLQIILNGINTCPFLLQRLLNKTSTHFYDRTSVPTNNCLFVKKTALIYQIFNITALFPSRRCSSSNCKSPNLRGYMMADPPQALLWKNSNWFCGFERTFPPLPCKATDPYSSCSMFLSCTFVSIFVVVIIHSPSLSGVP